MQERKRWNFVGYIGAIIATILLVGLIKIAPQIHTGLQYVVYGLPVFVIVGIFAILRRNIKRMCNNKLNNN